VIGLYCKHPSKSHPVQPIRPAAIDMKKSLGLLYWHSQGMLLE
jgi:hypothetical protein